jgi:outer membrane protein assembly factor BamB
MSLRALNALTGKQRWSAEVPCSTGPVAVAGLVCAGGPDGMLSALDAGSGTIGWQQRAGRSAITALTTAEDMLYAVTAENDDSQVHAVKAVNGSAAWRWSAPGTLTRPLVSDGMLFAGSSDGSVYAVDVATGKGPEMPRSYT